MSARIPGGVAVQRLAFKTERAQCSGDPIARMIANDQKRGRAVRILREHGGTVGHSQQRWFSADRHTAPLAKPEKN
jgi:hypothetical protein